MSIEDRLRSGLTANADPTPPPVEAHLVAVNRRYRRRLAVRAVTATAAVVVLAAVGWWAVAQLLGGGHLEPAEQTVPGTYRVAVQDSDVTGDLAGTWLVTLGSDGSITYTTPLASGLVAGVGESYVLEGDQLRTNALIGFPGCQRTNPATGTYTVTADRDGVTFRVVSDGCAARRALFGSPWERQP